MFDATGDRIYAGDEDFSPFRLIAQITSGHHRHQDGPRLAGKAGPRRAIVNYYTA